MPPDLVPGPGGPASRAAAPSGEVALDDLRAHGRGRGGQRHAARAPSARTAATASRSCCSTATRVDRDRVHELRQRRHVLRAAGPLGAPDRPDDRLRGPRRLRAAPATGRSTPTGGWMAKNAWKFGWLMSYPKGKTDVTCYIYEPWHYRYVGRDIAAKIRESGLTIREYLWEHHTTVDPVCVAVPSATLERRPRRDPSPPLAEPVRAVDRAARERRALGACPEPGGDTAPDARRDRTTDGTDGWPLRARSGGGRRRGPAAPRGHRPGGVPASRSPSEGCPSGQALIGRPAGADRVFSSAGGVQNAGWRAPCDPASRLGESDHPVRTSARDADRCPATRDRGLVRRSRRPAVHRELRHRAEHGRSRGAPHHRLDRRVERALLAEPAGDPAAVEPRRDRRLTRLRRRRGRDHRRDPRVARRGGCPRSSTWSTSPRSRRCRSSRPSWSSAIRSESSSPSSTCSSGSGRSTSSSASACWTSPAGHSACSDPSSSTSRRWSRGPCRCS